MSQDKAKCERKGSVMAQAQAELRWPTPGPANSTHHRPHPHFLSPLLPLLCSMPPLFPSHVEKAPVEFSVNLIYALVAA